MEEKPYQIKEVKIRNTILEAINAVTNKIYLSLDYQTITREAVAAMIHYGKTSLASIYEYKEDTNCLVLKDYSNEFSPESKDLTRILRIGQCACGEAVLQKKIIFCEDIAADKHILPDVKRVLSNEGRTSAIFIPLLFQNRVLGTMNLLFDEKYHFEDYELETLLSIGKTIGMAIANAEHIALIKAEVNQRKQAEEALRDANDKLEKRVKERTADLRNVNEMLKREDEERKKALEALQKREEELEVQSHHLQEVNAALKVLLQQREDDKRELQENVVSNVKDLILPYIEQLKKITTEKDQRTVVGILEANLNNIVSPFIRKVSSKMLKLTPMEIRICSLIKEGKTSKEIAELLFLSENTILFHRYNIRTKLGVKNQKINIISYLRSFE
ncbi:MAG TPA: GAF domain-containing protein [Smithellaceae bacterium]|nr:GAF domain-containing protein [Smithellaceae bacterium]